jgi:hypothetical protein
MTLEYWLLLGIEAMELTRVSTSYSVEVSTDTLLEICRLDGEQGAGDTLYDRLSALEGVIEVDYDPHFGPFINLDILFEHDHAERHAEISEVISEFTQT